MSDLISKNEVIDLLYKTFDEYRISTDKTSTLDGFGSEVFKRVREMPTAYDINKVVEELEEIKGLACDGKSCGECEYTSDCLEGEQSEKVAIDDAIEIVKQGGVSDDVCEWKSDYGLISDKYKRETSCGYTFYDLHHAVPFKFCPYCGKKIKVVE